MTATQPPHSIEAEQSVLGAVLLDNEAWGAVAGLLEPRDFYDPVHGAIWGTLSALQSANKLADVITVHEAGGHGLVYLNDLAGSVVSARGAASYAQIVREHALRREAMRLAMQLRDDALAGMLPLAGLVDRSVTALLALLQGARREEPQPMSERLRRFVDELNDRYEGRDSAIGTGLEDLDRLTGGGGRPGELWVLGARPSMGKSAFVLSLARHVGRWQGVLLLTMEDSMMNATARDVAAAGRINLADLRNPRGAPESMWSALSEAIEELAALRVYMDDQPALGVADVRRKLQQVTLRHEAPRLLIVDYLQMMDGEGENRNRELGKIAYQLQALGKETGTWIVLLSQLSREADKRNGPPQMSDLRDSGDIEAAARWIGMLYREWMRKPTAENKHWAQLHVCKQSNGPTDTLDLYFDGAVQRFGNWEGPTPWRAGGRGSG